MSAKQYTWIELIATLIIPSDELSQTKYKAAIDYCCNMYCNKKNQVFSEADMEFITEEIKEEEEHKIRLAQNDLQQQELRKDWPGLDSYVESLIARGPYPGPNK